VAAYYSERNRYQGKSQSPLQGLVVPAAHRQDEADGKYHITRERISQAGAEKRLKKCEIDNQYEIDNQKDPGRTTHNYGRSKEQSLYDRSAAEPGAYTYQQPQENNIASAAINEAK
jgi:hypothetical protein